MKATASPARDAGLVRGIGPLALGAAIINGVVGAGIFTLPAAMALAAGALAPWAYVACAVAMGAVVACFAEAGSRVPTSGGAAGYVGEAFGPMAGFVAGMLTWLSCVLAAGGIARALAESVAGLTPHLSGRAGEAATVLCTMAVLTVIHLRGVRTASRIVAAGTVVKLLPLLLFVVAGLAAGSARGTVPPGSGEFGRALILALFAFSGMETPLSASGEVARPNRTVPLALFGGMGFVLALYVAIQLVAGRVLGAALSGSAAPLADAASILAPAARLPMLTAAALSMLIWLGSDVLGAPRLLFAFARDGILPPALGRVNRAHVPAAAILLHVALTVVLALTGSFAQLAVLASLDGAGLYMMACAACVVLRRRNVAEAGVPLRLPALPLVAGLGVAGMGAVILVARPLEIAGLVASVVVSAGLYWIGVRRFGGQAAVRSDSMSIT